MTAPTEWFRDWFGDAYLSLYPHRDEAEAGQGVRLFETAARPAKGARVLDLACGVGRHLLHLTEAGHTAVGIDLSARLLAEARALLGPEAHLVRGDMRRLPFRDGSFGALANFFTSFGYFATEEEDRDVVEEIRRVLRPGGVFLMDYLNAPYVRDTLIPDDELAVDGRIVRQTRWLEGGTVTKRIDIHSTEDDRSETFYERVRMYEPEELTSLLARLGLVTTARFGGYQGEPHDAGAARLLLVGHAE